VEDLIKQISEVDEENPAFAGLILTLGPTLNSDFDPGFLQDLEPDSSWDQEISG